MKISKKYQRTLDLYKQLATPYECDLSEKALEEFIAYDSKGIGDLKCIFGAINNGYLYGQRLMNITIGEWRSSADRYGWNIIVRMLLKDQPEWFVRKAFDSYVSDNGKKVYEELFKRCKD